MPASRDHAPRVLIVAGSDSGGGAGLQADIRTVTMLGGYAATAITAITAQNSLGVQSVMTVPSEMVVRQIESVLDDIGTDAVKIGMLGSAETAEAVADFISSSSLSSSPQNDGAPIAPSGGGRSPIMGSRFPAEEEEKKRDSRVRGNDGLVPIVFDPVMAATSGAALADAATIAAFERLMALATVVTPNAPELAALTGLPTGTTEQLEAAAVALARRTGSAVLAKGGHLDGDEIVDLLASADGAVERWSAPRIGTRSTHGTGCTLASAIAFGLGHGLPLGAAVAQARTFVRIAMLAAPGLGAGQGPMGHQAAAWGAMNLNQVTLPAQDYDASVVFYRALGLVQIVDSPGRYARFETPGGGTLSIHVEPGTKAGDAIVCLESASLDSWVERLRADGIAFDSLPTDQRWGWREAHLRDPAGNRLCLYRAGEYRRFPPWRLIHSFREAGFQLSLEPRASAP